MDLHCFSDIHTHQPGRTGSILSTPVNDVESVLLYNQKHPEAPQYYSLQLHPWHLTGEADITRYQATAQRLSQDPQLVAIGECGLDSLCDVPLDLQLTAFRAALLSARQLQRPVIIHCVRLWAEMQREVQDVLPHHPLPIIIHGFRKGPALAQQLLAAGFSFSLGPKHHPDLISLLPTDKIYYETDETNT